MTIESCEDCNWGRFALAATGEPLQAGDCMVNPPIPVVYENGEVDSWWPVVGRDDYCSLFKPRV